MQSDPVVFLDNCNHETLTSNLLARGLRPTIGSEQMVPSSANAFIVITGNAVQLSEDLPRRFIVVDLDAKCENPEQRRFDQNFFAFISARRSELVGAFLTIWRWGRQNQLPEGMPLGSFEAWASWCRDPLLALGCVDPALRITDLKIQDPLRQRTVDLFEAWHTAHGSKPVNAILI
jgi:hypothetical protein